MKKLLTFLALLVLPAAALAQEARESAFERVLRTGVIRCGYFNYAPAFTTDVNTGQHAGILYDIFEELAKTMQLKIEWSQEINLSTFLQDLNASRYDLECSGGWPNAQRARQVLYTKPLFYAPLYLYARADDHRFDNNRAALNDAKMRFVTIEGEFTNTLRQRQFPLSANVTLPPAGASLADLAQNVVANKADVLVLDRATFLDFNAKNPGLIRQVDGPPVSVNTFTISVPGGDLALQQLLNTAIDELQMQGAIDSILRRHEPAAGTYLRPANPFQLAPQE